MHMDEKKTSKTIWTVTEYQISLAMLTLHSSHDDDGSRRNHINSTLPGRRFEWWEKAIPRSREMSWTFSDHELSQRLSDLRVCLSEEVTLNWTRSRSRSIIPARTKAHQRRFEWNVRKILEKSTGNSVGCHCGKCWTFSLHAACLVQRQWTKTCRKFWFFLSSVFNTRNDLILIISHKKRHFTMATSLHN